MEVKVNGVVLEVSYELLEVDEEKARVRVRAWTSDYPDGYTHWVDLPMVSGRIVAPQGAQLDDLVRGVFPMAEFARVRAEKPDLSGLKDLVVAPAPPAPEQEPPAPVAPQRHTLRIYRRRDADFFGVKVVES